MTAPVQRLPMLEVNASLFVPVTLHSPPLPAFGYPQFFMEVFKTSHFGDEKQSILIWEFCFNVSWKMWSQRFTPLYLICTPCLGYVSQRPIQPTSQISYILIKHNYFIFLFIFQPKKIFWGVHILSEETKSPLKNTWLMFFKKAYFLFFKVFS